MKRQWSEVMETDLRRTLELWIEEAKEEIALREAWIEDYKERLSELVGGSG